MEICLKEKTLLTTVAIFLLPNDALIRHLYSTGSWWCWCCALDGLGFGLVRPSSETKRSVINMVLVEPLHTDKIVLYTSYIKPIQIL
jgi:hypothetical protein